MCLVALWLLAMVSSQQAAAPTDRADDRGIVEAVLAQVIRPEVDKLLARPDGWRGSPIVVFLDRTMPMCPNKSGPWEACIEEAALLTGPGEGWWPQDVAVAFAQRNGQSVAAPTVSAPNVVSARYEATEGRRPFEQFPNAAGWLSVSLPGYRGSNLALVYVNFACGAMCCSESFILLERAPDGWRVKGKHQLVIC